MTTTSHSKLYTPDSAAADVNAVLALLRGRWKLLILFHLFDGKIQRFSDLEHVVSGISQGKRLPWNSRQWQLQVF
ncbi:helix-turn-helix transcriptional regulator [Pseudomonas sp. TH41]|uniref:winged helix-turn-helix transcriptional regulator n=1 Tax=Pseudomonas sp. TH41 TaxID=2796405 RepID=UPI0019125911|nr:helix-turn-helix transcriptional regulator [Pseudomonas sp. TH41]